MNKNVLITLAVIVGLLALWLLVSVIFPEATTTDTEDDSTGETTEPVDIDETAVRSHDVQATVEIVGPNGETASMASSSDQTDLQISIIK